MVQDPSSDAPGRLVAQVRPGDNAPPVSVSELSNALKRSIEDQFGQVRVRGEISGFKRPASGHLYFALKDDKALIDAVMWRGTAGRLNFAAEDGLDVVATGKLTTFPGRSKYQIVVDSLELAGEGALMQLFEKLKARLTAEGLFDADNRRPIPYLPRVIGIVTSPTGAVIRDIIHRLSDRFAVHVLVWPVRVQGDGAAAEIAAALEGFSALPEGGSVPRPDLLIVARGGGSIEDLWAFNEEIVVRAIAGCSIPVMSAVGHETDTTLSDFAADWRAPTPSAAAERAVPVRADLLGHVAAQKLRLDAALRRNLALATERLGVQMRLMPGPADILSVPQQRCDELSERLRHGLGNRTVIADRRLAGAAGALRPALLTTLINGRQARLDALRLTPAMLGQRLAAGDQRLDAAARMLGQLHPDRPLARGYARVTGRDGGTLTSADAARTAHALTLHFGDGTVDAVVEGAGDAKSKPAAKPSLLSSAGQKRQDDLFG